MKHIKLNGTINVKDQAELQEIYSYLANKLFKLSKNGLRLYAYAINAELIGKYTPLSIEKITKELSFKSKQAATSAIKELENLKILEPTEYKELFILNREKAVLTEVLTATGLKINIEILVSDSLEKDQTQGSKKSPIVTNNSASK